MKFSSCGTTSVSRVGAFPSRRGTCRSSERPTASTSRRADGRNARARPPSINGWCLDSLQGRVSRRAVLVSTSRHRHASAEQGLAAPIDVQISGRRADSDYALARAVARRVREVPGAADVRIRQVMDEPEIFFTVDRDRAEAMGLTQQTVAQALLVSLSGSFQSAPNFCLDPANGVNYSIVVQTPQYKLTNFDELRETPSPEPRGGGAGALRPTSLPRPDAAVPAVVNHYNIQPTFDVYAQPDGRDLGGVARDVDRIVSDMRPELPRGVSIDVARAGPKHAGVVQGFDRGDLRRVDPRVHHPDGHVPDGSRSAGHYHGAAGRREPASSGPCSSRGLRLACLRSWG